MLSLIRPLRAPWWSYLVGVCCTSAALLATHQFPAWFGGIAIPAPLCIAAVLVSALVGGLGPALLASLMSVTALAVVLPLGVGADRPDAPHLVELATFCVAASVAVALPRSWRAALDANQANRGMQALLESLMTTAPVGLGFLDRRLCYIRVNDELARMNGLSAAAHQGKSVREVLPDAASVIEPVCRQVMRTGEPVVGVELIGMTPAFPGETRCCLASYYPVRDLNGAVLGVGFVGVDITERRRAEGTQARLAAIVESATDAILCGTPEGVITDWNPAAERLFGYTAAEAVGRPACMLFPVQEASRAPAIFRQPMEQAQSRHYEATAVRSDGALLDLSFSVSSITDRRGEAIGAAMIARDMTERRNLERLRDQFLTIAAHELKTPLTVLRGGSQMLLRRTKRGQPLDERYIGLLETMDEQTASMARLVDELLDLSRIEAGRLALRPEPMDIAALLRHTVNQQRLLHPEREIILRGAEEPAAGVWDRVRMEQVFINLLDNAVKYSPPASPVTVSLHVALDEVEIAVEDRGIGVAAADLTRVFERHFRGGNVGVSPSGLGIGLYLAGEIVERHSGRIEVRSQEGQGAIFLVSLPRQRPAADAGDGAA